MTENQYKTSLATCVFSSSRWNDFEQKNYTLYFCSNPENTGGKERNPFPLDSGDSHSPRTYSCWHKNEGMKHRCWEKSEKIAECPMAKAEED